jgi:hypothetical protein
MRVSHVLAVAILASIVSACGNGAHDAAQQATANPAATARAGLWFEPASLESCDTRSLVKVYWNVTASKRTKAVNVFTLRPGGEEAVFAGRAKPEGMRRTGHWIRAGRVFVVREAASGADLARGAVGTTPCTQGAAQSAP